jgi:hypothetical protein
MPNPALTLFVNSDKNLLLQGWQSNSQAIAPILKQGDTVGIELHWVRDSATNTSTMTEVAFSPSSTISLAIGLVEEPPTFGTFTLTFGAGETTPLDFDATAIEVQTALNSLATITAVGGVTVSLQGRSYRIFFNTAGVLTNAISFKENDLFPTSSIGIIEARVGSASARAIYQVHIKQSPVAYTETFINQDPAVASIEVINIPQFTGDNKTWRLSLSSQPKGGTFIIQFAYTPVGTITTEAISVDITAGDLRAILDYYLQTADKGEFTIQKTGSYSWDISTSLTSVTSVAVFGSGIQSFASKYCELSLNNVEVENLLNGERSASAYLEIETIQSGVRTTLIQTVVTIVNDLIDEADYTVVSRSDVMPIDSVVRYDTSQALSDAQKTQARNNIGAVGGGTDVGNLATQVAGLDTRVGGLESTTLTTNQRAAIAGATTPSATNLFATEAFVIAEGANYAPLSHTQALTSITGLSAALAGKADAVHTHTTADVAGLEDSITTINTSLAAKANSSHIHTISQVTDLTASLNGKLSIADFTTQTADFVTDTELNAGLAQKSNTGHNHSISEISSLQSNLTYIDTRLDAVELSSSNPLTTNQREAIIYAEVPTSANVFMTLSAVEAYKGYALDNAYVRPADPYNYQPNSVTTNLTGTRYNYEVIVVVDGNTWIIPARQAP